MLCKDGGKKVRIKELFVFEGLGRTEVIRYSGDLCAIIGLDDFEIGDTLADLENPEAMPRISIDEPTMSMLFTINNSPFLVKKVSTLPLVNRDDFKETEKNLAYE